MEKLEKIIGKYWWVLILILSIPLVWALFVKGYYGASDDLHIGWLYEMDQAFRMGQIPPRFVPDLSFGFGYPLFNYVFPLPFYLGELFHLAGLSLVDSIKGVFLISFPLSMMTMYLLLKKLTTPVLALAGAVVYAYTPYRATDVYVRGDIGEIVSFIFLPLLVLALLHIFSEEEKVTRWVGVGGLSLAGLVLTHNITAYMFLPFLILLGVLLFIFVTKKREAVFVNVFLMGVLGALSSLFFWLPAIADAGLVKYDTVFNFIDHFPTLAQLITPYFGYGASVPGPGDGMSFFIGTVNWLLFLGGGMLTAVFWKKFSPLKQTILIWLLVTFLSCIFIMNFRSAFLWYHLPFLPYFQFPWRFLIMTTLATSILVLSLENLPFSRQIGLGIIVLAILLNWTFYRPHDFLGREDSYYINRYIPTPIASDEYKKTGEEYLRLPVGTKIRPDKNYPLIFPDSGSIQNIKILNALSASFDTSSSSAMVINYSKYNFPGWQVTVDSEPVAVTAGEPFGQVSFQVPPGDHRVLVAFRETAFKVILDLISLVAIIFTAIKLFLKR